MAYLERNRERLMLDRFGPPQALSCILATPGFQASAHVVFLVLAEGTSHPVLVLKAPRLPGAGGTLDREAANLRAVHLLRQGGFDSIPRLLAYDEFAGTPLLVETGLPGRAMSPAFVRRRPAACAEALLAWLLELHTAPAVPALDPRLAFERLLARPLAGFASCFPLAAGDDDLIERTAEIVAPLREGGWPQVFEHGDLSAPNILVSDAGEVGVVDWELAEPRGLPGSDLFFTLAYLAFARRGARRIEDHVSAFDEAFFGDRAWARPYVERYARRMGLAFELLRPLFVACWSRYVIVRAWRVGGLAPDPEGGSAAAEWLRRDRYYALWRHAVRHADEIRLAPSPRPALGAAHDGLLNGN